MKYFGSAVSESVGLWLNATSPSPVGRPAKDRVEVAQH